MKKLAVLSIVCLLAPAFSAGAVETIQRKHASKANEQKTNVRDRHYGCPSRPIAIGPRPIFV
jgi:hypothetical protein